MANQLVLLIVLWCGIAAWQGFAPAADRPSAQGRGPADAVRRAEDRQRSRYPVQRETTATRTLRFAGQGARTLDVSLINGSIRVAADSGDEVRIDIRRTVRARTDEDLPAADREVLQFTDQSSLVEVVGADRDGHTCGDTRHDDRDWSGRPRYLVHHDLTIRVPRDTRLLLCTINGGEVHVEGTRGAFEIDNINGGITLDGVRGSGYARTINGEVTAVFEEAPAAASEFKTLNGHVTITFPADLSADLRLKTFNGGLYTDFDVQPLTAPTPRPERRDGLFVYRSRDQYALVRAGRGGVEHTFESFNGNVRVRRAPR